MQWEIKLIGVVEVYAVDVFYDSVVGPERCTRLANMHQYAMVVPNLVAGESLNLASFSWTVTEKNPL